MARTTRTRPTGPRRFGRWAAAAAAGVLLAVTTAAPATAAPSDTKPGNTIGASPSGKDSGWNGT